MLPGEGTPPVIETLMLPELSPLQRKFWVVTVTVIEGLHCAFESNVLNIIKPTQSVSLKKNTNIFIELFKTIQLLM